MYLNRQNNLIYARIEIVRYLNSNHEYLIFSSQIGNVICVTPFIHPRQQHSPCMRWRNWNLQALFQTSNSQYFDSFAQYYREFTVVINSRCKILAQRHERNRNANDLELSRYGWNGTFCGRGEWEAEKEDGKTLNCADWRRFSVAKRYFYRIWFNAIRLALHNYIAECNINLIGCQQVSIRMFRNRTQQSQRSKDIFAIYSFLIGTNKTLET